MLLYKESKGKDYTDNYRSFLSQYYTQSAFECMIDDGTFTLLN